MLLLALSSLALPPPAHISQILTPVVTLPAIIQSTPDTNILQVATATPGKIRPTTAIPLAKQAGNSDRIVLIGILIFGIIVVPMILKRNQLFGK
jgi:hypothetical protein